MLSRFLKKRQRSARLRPNSQIDDKMVNINIEVPDEIHKKIKILSAMQDTPIKELIVKALEENIKNESKHK